MLLFTNLIKGGHQGGQGGRYFMLKSRISFEKNKTETKFQHEIASPLSPLVSPFDQICKKQHLSFHWKKLNFYLQN